jgi:hypothetical protein
MCSSYRILALMRAVSSTAGEHYAPGNAIELAHPHKSAPKNEFSEAFPHRQKNVSAAFSSCGLQWLDRVTHATTIQRQQYDIIAGTVEKKLE